MAMTPRTMSDSCRRRPCTAGIVNTPVPMMLPMTRAVAEGKPERVRLQLVAAGDRWRCVGSRLALSGLGRVPSETPAPSRGPDGQRRDISLIVRVARVLRGRAERPQTVRPITKHREDFRPC